MDKPENRDTDNAAQAHEPEAPYKKASIRFYASFEEMNAADHEELAAMSGVQHLMNVTYMLQHMYKDELRTEPWRHIHFNYSRYASKV